MKAFLFFTLIVLAMIVSSILGDRSLTSQRRGLLLICSFFIPVLILGGSSIWIFLTESDGISQGISFLVNAGALAVCGIITVIFFIKAKFTK